MSNYAALDRPAINQRVPLIAGSLLIFAVLLGASMAGAHSIMPEVNRVVGMVLVALYLVCHLTYRLKVPIEIILFGAFAAWASISGVAIAADSSAAMGSAKFLVQLWVLVLAVAGFSYAARSPAGPLMALLAFAGVMVLRSWMSGAYELGFGTDVRTRGEIGWNPNSFGFLMLAGIMSLAYLWRFHKSIHFKIVRFAMPLAAAVMAVNLVATASRKSFVILLFFGLLYVWFCYKHEVLKNLWAVVAVIVVAAAGWMLVDFMLHGDTVMALRWQTAQEEGGLGESRTLLYMQGLDIFFDNPIAGVGLGNFGLASGGELYAHSEYMEILATTGAIGAALYFPIFPILWLRLWKIGKSTNDLDVKYRIGVCKAVVLSLLALGVGAPLFLSINMWVTLGAIIGYACSLEHAMRKPAPVVPRRVRVLVPRRI